MDSSLEPIIVTTPTTELRPEELEKWEKTFYTELEDFFEIPRNSFIDSLGTVNASQPYTTQVPPGTSYEDEESFDEIDMLPSQSEDVIQRFVSLFQDYEQSVKGLLAQPLVESPSAPSTLTEDAESVKEEYAMSKHQMQLTVDEGNLWESLANPAAPDATEMLASLAQQSEALTKSYEKRNNPPTEQTYEESKIIIRAMGVPCIETAVPYEAEALAASLVRHGLADYVASEDTVRLDLNIYLIA